MESEVNAEKFGICVLVGFSRKESIERVCVCVFMYLYNMYVYYIYIHHMYIIYFKKLAHVTGGAGKS